MSYCTGPNSPSFDLVSWLNGVEAKIQTPPFLSLMAVDRPPTGTQPNRVKGLHNISEERLKRAEADEPRESEDIFSDLFDSEHFEK